MSDGSHAPPDSWHQDGLGDHVHTIAQEGRTPVVVSDFNYDTLEEQTQTMESMISVAQAASGLVKILDWCAESKDFHSAGAKIAALHVMLDPVNGKFRNLSEISRATGISRASLSKSLADLRDRYGLGLTVGKFNSSRLAYRRAQYCAISGTQ